MIKIGNINEFTYDINPDPIIKSDTLMINADPIILIGKEDWEKGIWIAGTLLINLVVYFAGREIKKRKKSMIVLWYLIYRNKFGINSRSKKQNILFSFLLKEKKQKFKTAKEMLKFHFIPATFNFAGQVRYRKRTRPA